MDIIMIVYVKVVPQMPAYSMVFRSKEAADERSLLFQEWSLAEVNGLSSCSSRFTTR